MRNVVRIETAAMRSGTSARSDAKTNASTARAPSAPSSVSSSTLGPPLSPPPEESCCVAGQATGEAVLLELGVERVLDRLLVGVDEPVAAAARR